MPISEELKRVYASAPVDRRYIDTVSFHHSMFTKDYWFTNDLQPWTFTLENASSQLFEVFPFKIILPNNDRLGNQDLQIGLSNVGREMMNELELANSLPQEPVQVVFRVFMDYIACSPQNLPVLSMTLVDIQVNRESVTGVARRADILNRPFPYEQYTLDTFPGLDR